MMDFWDELNKVYNMDIPDEATEIIGDVMIALTELPERKKGRWKTAYLDHEAMGERPKILYCSECNQCIAYPTNFCPNCGADMREEGEQV